jgi:hypothetical protein
MFVGSRNSRRICCVAYRVHLNIAAWPISLRWAGLNSGNSLDLYSGGIYFKSRSVCQLYWNEAVPYLKRLVAGFPPRRPGFAPGQVMWDLWCTKWDWARFSPSTSVSSANRHSTRLSSLIITQGMYSRPIGGRRAEWTQLDSTPTIRIKKKLYW